MGVIVNNKLRLTVQLTALLSSLLSTANAEYYPATYPELQPVVTPIEQAQHVQPVQNKALPWWNERDILIPEIKPNQTRTPNFTTPAQRHYQQTAQAGVRIQRASYTKNPARFPNHEIINCQNASVLNLPDRCIQRSAFNRRGLEEQIRYLRRHNPAQPVAQQWANVSNGTLLQTAHELLNWEQGFSTKSLQEKFFLREIGSHKHTANADYTGYFTPVLQVQNYPDQRYRFPIYTAPRGGTRLTRSEIERGALRNKNLEIAWTNDRVHLFFAHIQGSAIARYPDGTERYLSYSDSNQHTFGKISQLLRNKGYMQGSLSNENIRRWLHTNPGRIDEVLNYNPRYIFFTLSDQLPRTATGATVLPGHTLAVDDRYIPLGAVLLAQIPRVDHVGKRIGSDWRLLFAQDRGNDIKGPGRVDMYTGMGTTSRSSNLPGHWPASNLHVNP